MPKTLPARQQGSGNEKFDVSFHKSTVLRQGNLGASAKKRQKEAGDNEVGVSEQSLLSTSPLQDYSSLMTPQAALRLPIENDLDFVIQLPAAATPQLVQQFRGDFYLDELSVRAAPQPPRPFHAIDSRSAIEALWMPRNVQRLAIQGWPPGRPSRSFETC